MPRPENEPVGIEVVKPKLGDCHLMVWGDDFVLARADLDQGTDPKRRPNKLQAVSCQRHYHLGLHCSIGLMRDLGSQMAERLGNQAINQKVAG